MTKENKESTLDERIVEALKDAPTIKGMTIMDMSRHIDEPQEGPKCWTVEDSYIVPKVRYVPLGRGKVYSLEEVEPLM